MSRITFQQAKTRFARYVDNGQCSDSDEVGQAINDAIQRIMDYPQKWVGKVRRFQFCTNKGCITLPREILNVEAVRICDRPMQIRNQWYDMLPDGPGKLSPGFSHDDAVQSKGDGFPLFVDLDPDNPRFIRVYCDVEEAAGARILIQGTDEDDNFVRTIDSQTGLYVDGEYVELDHVDAATTTRRYKYVKSVQKPQTQGYVRLYSYEPGQSAQSASDITSKEEWLENFAAGYVAQAGASSFTLGYGYSDEASRILYLSFSRGDGEQKISLYDSDGSTLLDSIVIDTTGAASTAFRPFYEHTGNLRQIINESQGAYFDITLKRDVTDVTNYTDPEYDTEVYRYWFSMDGTNSMQPANPGTLTKIDMPAYVESEGITSIAPDELQFGAPTNFLVNDYVQIFTGGGVGLSFYYVKDFPTPTTVRLSSTPGGAAENIILIGGGNTLRRTNVYDAFSDAITTSGIPATVSNPSGYNFLFTTTEAFELTWTHSGSGPYVFSFNPETSGNPALFFEFADGYIIAQNDWDATLGADGTESNWIITRTVTAEQAAIYAQQNLIAIYAPDEEIPSFARIYIPGLDCDEQERKQVTVMATLRFIPLVNDIDILPISNAAAIQLMLRCMSEERNGTLQNAMGYEMRAIEALTRELTNTLGAAPKFRMGVDPLTGAGDIGSVV